MMIMLNLQLLMELIASYAFLLRIFCAMFLNWRRA